MDWYYFEGDQQRGPISKSELNWLAGAGRISDETLVWREGMPDWKPFGAVKISPFFIRDEEAQPGPPPHPADAGVVREEEASPSFEASPAVAGTLDYAGFWIRFCAYLLDVIVLVIISVGVGVFLGLAMAAGMDQNVVEAFSALFQIGIGASYETFFHGKFGATPGKMALGLKVIMPDGSRLSYGRAFCRFLAEILSGLIFLIGYIMAAFDSEKRALHDRLCDTRVIRE